MRTQRRNILTEVADLHSDITIAHRKYQAKRRGSYHAECQEFGAKCSEHDLRGSQQHCVACTGVDEASARVASRDLQFFCFVFMSAR